MTGYVDNVRIPATVGRYTACWSHLFTDSPDLTGRHALAPRSGLRRSWFPDKVCGAHYEVTDRTQVAALAAGAAPIHWRQAGAVWWARRVRDGDHDVTTPEGVA